MGFPSSGKGGIDERDALAPAHEQRVGDPQHFMELLRWDLERAGGWCRSWRGLRKCRRPRSVERNAPFHLLSDLMDVPVEDRHRSKAGEKLQGLGRIIRAPPPLGIDSP